MLYAAYGSNLNKKQMKYRCPNAKPFCVGKIENYKLKFSYHANIVPCKGESVPVVLWDIPTNGNDWSNLDRYEGLGKYYDKIIIPTVTDFGTFNVAVYVMVEDYDYCPPSDDYYNTISKGYFSFALDEEYLFDKLKECYRKYNTKAWEGWD